MPISGPDFPIQSSFSIGLEPVQNLFYSSSLLNRESYRPSLSEWVTQVRSSMTLEELQRHRLVMVGLCYAVQPGPGWQSYLNYVDHLSSLAPQVLVDKLLSTYARYQKDSWWEWDSSRIQYDKRRILASVDNYLAFLNEHFPPDHVDPELEAQAYSYVINPPAMKELIVQHLRWMWETHLAAEWARVHPMLVKVVRAFERINYAGMDRLEAVRFITGQDVPDEHWAQALNVVTEVTFIPNPHAGPYVSKLLDGRTVSVVFGAHLPEGADEEIPELSRADILIRLGTLADDTRLRILRYIADNGEARAQDLILSLEISQPAASRHLTQLAATGFLTERRVNGVKTYQLNQRRIEDTMQAAANFLASKERQIESV